jgi:hypothetical protein
LHFQVFGIAGAEIRFFPAETEFRVLIHQEIRVLIVVRQTLSRSRGNEFDCKKVLPSRRFCSLFQKERAKILVIEMVVEARSDPYPVKAIAFAGLRQCHALLGLAGGSFYDCFNIKKHSK